MDSSLPVIDIDYVMYRSRFKLHQDDLLKGRRNLTLVGLLMSVCVAAAFKFKAPPPLRIASVALSPIALFLGYKFLMPSKQKISEFSDQQVEVDGIALNLQDRMHVQEKEKHTKLWLAIVALIVIIVAGAVFALRLPQSIKMTITGATVILTLAAYIQLPYIRLKKLEASNAKAISSPPVEPPAPESENSEFKSCFGEPTKQASSGAPQEDNLNNSLYQDVSTGDL